jgi:hypothetical protein
MSVGSLNNGKYAKIVDEIYRKGMGSIWREGKRRSSSISLCFSAKRVTIKLIYICRNSKRLPRKSLLSWQLFRKLWSNNTYIQQRDNKLIQLSWRRSMPIIARLSTSSSNHSTNQRVLNSDNFDSSTYNQNIK